MQPQTCVRPVNNVVSKQIKKTSHIVKDYSIYTITTNMMPRKLQFTVE